MNWFTIIYENENFLVVNKKSGISMHPAGRFEDFNLVLEIQKDLGYKAYPVMRLDRETSGICIFGKTSEAAAHLSYLIREKKIQKKYQCVVFGVPNPKEQIIENEIGERICDYGKGWKKCIDGKKAQHAITHIKVLKSNSEYSLVEVETKTGRQHQIRVHLSSIGHPIVGDKIYKEDWVFDKCVNELDYVMTKEMIDVVKSDRLLLHASYVKFEDFEFNCEIPKEFEKFI
ncbi:MAG: RNA pseudouridine synthase [Candidatus Woesearchaeota archaeon]|jgi:23S rRNA pseudouridine1911/1915/1917 synthase